MTNDRTLLLALSKVPNVGPKTVRRMLQYFGNLEELFKASRNRLSKFGKKGIQIFYEIRKPYLIEQAKESIRFLQKRNCQLIPYYDKGFPYRLKESPWCPLFIFSKCTVDLNKGRFVSIVGTRTPSKYGRHHVRRLVEQMQDKNIITISGLAHGIDSLAHRWSLTFGIPTLAILGHGLDRIYPADHLDLSLQIQQNGGLISEFDIGTNPDRENFPMRNRIIAGMSDAMIVIQSGIRGGSIISANMANEYNREVFALPGSIGDKFSKGCHDLIKGHKAHLIEDFEDVEYIMNWSSDRVVMRQTSLFAQLDEGEHQVMNVLKGGPAISLDRISNLTHLGSGHLAKILLGLEMKGHITSLPGKLYSANN